MSAPTVSLSDGGDASGMATMLAGLLGDNLGDFPGRAGVARIIRGNVVFTAIDRDMSVTIRFLGDRIEVKDGTTDGAATIEAPWLTMAKLCSGQISPPRALAAGNLKVSPGRRPLTTAAASFVVSVPSSYYGDPRRRRLIVAVASAVVVVVLLGAVRRQSRPDAVRRFPMRTFRHGPRGP